VWLSICVSLQRSDSGKENSEDPRVNKSVTWKTKEPNDKEIERIRNKSDNRRERRNVEKDGNKD